MKTDLSKLTDALAQHVRLASFPVAARMVKPGEQLPERVKRPAQDLKIKVDEAKKQKEVAHITESDYFRQLQENAQRMRQEFDI